MDGQNRFEPSAPQQLLLHTKSCGSFTSVVCTVSTMPWAMLLYPQNLTMWLARLPLLHSCYLSAYWSPWHPALPKQRKSRFRLSLLTDEAFCFLTLSSMPSQWQNLLLHTSIQLTLLVECIPGFLNSRCPVRDVKCSPKGFCN